MSKIMIVEDDLDLCETYTDFLEAAGHTVKVITSSAQAIDALIRERNVPDLVILDMNLPGESGIVVLGFIRRLPRLHNTKVIIVSGYVDMANRAIAEWGADLFLPKPVSLEKLRTSIGTFTSQNNVVMQ
ncbi:MAG: response regulator [Chloroflexi bacterium]|nr:response regulator [Chloroflexota bacterium]